VQPQDNPRALSVKKLASLEISQTVGVLSRAFRDNPLNRVVTRSASSEDRLRSNRYGMQALLPVAIRHGQALVATLDGVVVGGLVATPPGRFPLPPPALLSRLRCIFGQGWQISRCWGEIFEKLELLHPIEPHWYLGTLGVDPDFQGQGVGRYLLSSWLEGIDREGELAYLETDDERNVAFYERAGFQVEGEISILAAPVWRMRRSPSRPAR
jgi:ribosomal protein S18 acetylase RimI-like enzyme